MSKQRAKGTAFETALLPWLRQLWPPVRRTGSAAYGDGDFAETYPYLIEAKNHNHIDLAGFMDQAQTAARGKCLAPVLIVKRRGRPVYDSYVVMRLGDWVDQ